jgi:hypothetical protein
MTDSNAPPRGVSSGAQWASMHASATGVSPIHEALGGDAVTLIAGKGRRAASQRRLCPRELQDVERHAVGFGSRSKIRAHVGARHCDRPAEPLGGGERLDHGCGQRPPLGTVASLE